MTIISLYETSCTYQIMSSLNLFDGTYYSVTDRIKIKKSMKRFKFDMFF